MLTRLNTAMLVALVLSQIAEGTGQRFEAVALAVFGFGAWCVLDGRRARRRIDREAKS